jgi:hypothetical protein
MKFPGYDTGKIKLAEGMWYPFRIHNHMQLQDGLWYYVLEDINGLKHFMPAGYYSNYSLKAGDKISCRIDRINCTGRIFLEPKHPLYKEGESYSFELLSYSKADNLTVFFVKDFYGNSIEVQQCGISESVSEAKKKVKCKVLSIKKGKPILEICDI